MNNNLFLQRIVTYRFPIDYSKFFNLLLSREKYVSSVYNYILKYKRNNYTEHRDISRSINLIDIRGYFSEKRSFIRQETNLSFQFISRLCYPPHPTYIHPRTNKAPYTWAKNFKLDIFRYPLSKSHISKLKNKNAFQNPHPSRLIHKENEGGKHRNPLNLLSHPSLLLAPHRSRSSSCPISGSRLVTRSS